jgi:hypothetical protein
MPKIRPRSGFSKYNEYNNWPRNPGLNLRYNPYNSARQTPAQPTKSSQLAAKLRGYTDSFLQQIYPGIGTIIGGLIGAAPGVFTGNLLAAGAGAYAGGVQGYHLGQLLNEGKYKPVAQAAYQGLSPHLEGKTYGDLDIQGAAHFANELVQGLRD